MACRGSPQCLGRDIGADNAAGDVLLLQQHRQTVSFLAVCAAGAPDLDWPRQRRQHVASKHLEVLRVAEKRSLLHGYPVQQPLEGVATCGEAVEIGDGILVMAHFVTNGATQPTAQGWVRAQSDAMEEYLSHAFNDGLGGVDAGHVCTWPTTRWIAAASLPSGSISVTAPKRSAALGIPNTAEDASSWASVIPPCRRIASSPCAPSSPIPVSNTPIA